MSRFLAALAIVSIAAAGARGQSLNVDIGVNSGAGAGAPVSSFAGAAAQPGVWNNVLAGASGSIALADLNGSPSACSITRHGTAGVAVSYGSGDFAKLMADYDVLTAPSATLDYTINGLAPGLYRLFVYTGLPTSQEFWTDNGNAKHYFVSAASIYLNNSITATLATSGPSDPTGQFNGARTHGILDIRIPTTAPLKVQLQTGATAHERAALAGLQLVRYDETRLYVDVDAVGANNGKSWSDAFTSLQDALQLATTSAGQITEIWIAAGNYFPGVLRTQSFVIPSGVKIYGGFRGNEKRSHSGSGMPT